MEYYSFIAGLPDISLDDAKSSLSLDTLKLDIEESVSEKDMKNLNLFYYAFDNKNLYALLSNANTDWSPLGTLSREDLEDFINFAKDGRIHQDDHLPPYFAEFVTAYFSNTPVFQGLNWQDQLTSLYYIHAIESKNDLIRSYFEFNLTLQNILIATVARKHQIDLNKVVIGDNEIAENIRTNTSKDFGIVDMFPYMDEVLHISEITSNIERELKIDALRWKWLEDNTVFHYFSKEYIFTYILKLEMINRWTQLDSKVGEKTFAKYVKALVKTVKIDIS